jgi:hypothetical protein
VVVQQFLFAAIRLFVLLAMVEMVLCALSGPAILVHSHQLVLAIFNLEIT